MSKELALIENALSLDQVMQQRNLVMQIMRNAMHEDQHYGKIPGCGEKPTLLLPGAQVMATTFRLTPSYVVVQEPESIPGHRSYQVTCILKHGDTVIGEGIGFGSSLESKHRYRNSAPIVENTGEPVPAEYWNRKNADGAAKANEWLGIAFDGQKVGPKKIDNEWKIVIYKGGTEGKVENPNPVDTFNTVLKMTKKRAFVDAVITATACNDLFTQDLEDIRQNLEAVDAEFSKKPDEPPIDAIPINPKKETIAKRPKTEGKSIEDRKKEALDYYNSVLVKHKLTDDTRRETFWNTASDIIDAPSDPKQWNIDQLNDLRGKLKQVLETVENHLNTIPTDHEK